MSDEHLSFTNEGNIREKDHHKKLLVAVDCIIFGFDGSELKALLIKRGFNPGMGQWSLMGGFVGIAEDVSQAANRVLFQLTGMKNVYMEQLYTFSDPNRDPTDRVISIVYFALINIKGYDQGMQSEYEAKWFELGALPSLILDHSQMIQKALTFLYEKAARYPIGFELLPVKFTMQSLQRLYEAIYRNKLDSRNFIKRILAQGVLTKLEEKDKLSSSKGAFLYVYDEKKYALLKSGDLKFFGR